MRNPKFKVITEFNRERIVSTISKQGTLTSWDKEITKEVLNLKECGIKNALRTLGWTPPGEHNKQVRELENEIDKLNKQIKDLIHGREKIGAKYSFSREILRRNSLLDTFDKLLAKKHGGRK